MNTEVRSPNRRQRPLPAFLLLTLTFSSTAAAAKADCAAMVPDPSTLRALGARIGQILFEPQDIFDERKPGERTLVFRTVNRLHVRTRPAALAAQLLFKSGDPYSPRLLDENARNLRRLAYLREPQFELRCFRQPPDAPPTVDVALITRDVWTLNPLLEYSRKGGENVSTIGVEDRNFLGLGKSIELKFRQDRNRNTRSLAYHDQNLGFGRRTLDVLLADNTDGHTLDLRLEQPFYALNTRRQWLLGIGKVDVEQPRSVFATEVDRYRQQATLADFGIGWSAGLDSHWVHRYFAGVRYERQRFSTVPGLSTLPPPADRELLIPYFRVEGIQDDFATTFNQDLIGRTEDLALGWNYALEVGQTAESLGSDRTATLLSARVADGIRIAAKQLLLLEAHAHTRLGTQREDTLTGMSGRYFYRHSDQSTFYAALSGDFGRNLDADRELVLGGENGLRAYPFDYQQGSSRALLTLEQRYFTDWQLLRLFRVGAAAFVDVGRVWGDSAVPSPQLGTLRSIGVGLRLGSTRAARANILHIDLAYPLDGRAQDRGLALIVETRATF